MSSTQSTNEILGPMCSRSTGTGLVCFHFAGWLKRALESRKHFLFNWMRMLRATVLACVVLARQRLFGVIGAAPPIYEHGFHYAPAVAARASPAAVGPQPAAARPRERAAVGA